MICLNPQCTTPYCSGCTPMLPSCEPCRPTEDVVSHGARVLAFLLQTSCTATLSDLELERAEIAAKYAIVARGISVTAADNLSNVRHVIAFVLADRKRHVVEAQQLATLGADRRPNEGPMAPLKDRPIVQPPAPSYATVKHEVQF